MLAGSAYLIDEGSGVCNAVGIDNLVDAIWLAAAIPAADGETFLVNDAEVVTWKEFYAAIATGIGLDLASVHRVQAPQFRISASEKLAKLAAKKSVLAALPLVPARIKRIAKAAASVWNPGELASGWDLPQIGRPQVTEESVLLQSCRWRYPTAKAERVLGYKAAASFGEGMRRTSEWLKFVGIAHRA